MNRPLRTGTSVALLLSSTLVAPGSADWPAGGLAACIDPADQIFPSVAPDGEGGAFISWADQRTERGIYVQRVTSYGAVAPGWPADGLPMSGAIAGIGAASIVPDGGGGAFVAWGGNTVARLQRITGSGEVAPGWTTGGISLMDTWPVVPLPFAAADGLGGVLIAWNVFDFTPVSTNIRVQRITGAGALATGWSLGGVPVSGVDGNLGFAAIASDGAGGAIVAWADASLGSGDILAQRIGANGVRAPGWPASGLVVCGAAGRQRSPRIAPDGAGGAFVTWHDERDLATTGADLYLQHISAEGTVAAGWPADGLAVCTAIGDQVRGQVKDDGVGGAILVWQDRRATLDGDLYAHRVTGGGAFLPGWPVNGLPVCDAAGRQEQAFDGAVVPDGTGGALFTWVDARDSLATGRDLYVHHLMADGSPAPGWPEDGLALCASAGDQTFASAATNGSGGAIVAWTDYRASATNGDIYAARINGDGSTPVLLSLVSAVAEPQAVRIEWSTDSPGVRAMLQRRTPDTSWMDRGELVSDGTGRFPVEDREVVAGGRYGYRLGFGDGSFAGEVWVTVPAASLSLSAAWDPAGRRLRVSCALPAEGPATLEVFDPAGRRRASWTLHGPGSGDHVLNLDRVDGLRSGLHLLRLRQGDRVATAKATVWF
ncbi:MAG TPA: hypothetical protein VJY35_04215 [Candidatus Eisenbacteria bacterium]|nr:hypothetical protein [Candidatus Eisenbacteria bacterium]